MNEIEYKGKRLVRIDPDYDVLWSDEEGVCCGVDEDDLIEIHEDFREKKLQCQVRLFGVHDWLRRWMAAADFAEGVTNPEFDYEKWNREGYALARQLRNKLPDDFIVEYCHPFEEPGKSCNCVEIERSTPALLMYDAMVLLREADVPEAESVLKHLRSFINQCNYPQVLEHWTSVGWDGEENDLVIAWDTSELDCHASISRTEFLYRIWGGENHGSKDDPCTAIGVGGCDIDDYNAADFALGFYDLMSCAMELAEGDGIRERMYHDKPFEAAMARFYKQQLFLQVHEMEICEPQVGIKVSRNNKLNLRIDGTGICGINLPDINRNELPFIERWVDNIKPSNVGLNRVTIFPGGKELQLSFERTTDGARGVFCIYNKQFDRVNYWFFCKIDQFSKAFKQAIESVKP